MLETFIFTDFLHFLIDFLHVFVTKSVKFGRTEVSIAPIDAKFQDLSFGKGPGAWFSEKYMFVVKKLLIFNRFFTVFVTKWVGNRFHELSYSSK